MGITPCVHTCNQPDAHHSGRVLDHQPACAATISGLPPEVHELPEREALAVRRFDRGADGLRVHIEDFAQVLNVYPERKYKAANYETLARVLLRAAGERSYEEFVRRMVFIVAIGNGDAHLKNWSLIYRDGLNAELAPAYDLVATTLYMPNDELGLNLSKTKRFEEVSLESFRRLARKCAYDVSRTEHIVREAVSRIRGAWTLLESDLRLDSESRGRIFQRWTGIPVMGE